MADAQLEPAAESEVEPELGDETETLAQETESDALVADEDLLASVESAVDEVQPELLGATQDVPPTQSLANKAFDEEALHDWLSDNPDGENRLALIVHLMLKRLIARAWILMPCCKWAAKIGMVST